MHNEERRSNIMIVKTGMASAMILVMVMAMAAASLSIAEVEASPPILDVTPSTQTLIAGENNVVTFTIRNAGTSTASQIFATLTLPSSTTGGALMVLLNGDGQWYIESLGEDEESAITAEIYVSPLAAGKLYPLTLAFSYQYYGTRQETRSIGFDVPLLNSTGALISASLSAFELKAGQSNNLTLELRNTGDADAKLVSATLTLPGATAGPSPLSLIGSDGKWTFSSIKPNESVVIPLTIYASPSSAGMVYQPVVTLAYSDYISSRQEQRYLALGPVFTPLPSVNIEASLSGSELRAGAYNDVNMTVRNSGGAAAESLILQLSLPGGQTGSSPLTLLGSDGSWSLGSLAPGEERIIPLRIFAAPSASGISTSLSVTASFTDNNSAKQQTRSMGVLVKGSVDFVILDSTTYPQKVEPGGPFSMTVTIINLGTSAAQSVIVYPNGTSTLQPSSGDKIFLGDLAVNVPSSFTINYLPQNASSGTYVIPVRYDYKDSLGQMNTATLDVPLQLVVEAKSSGGGQPQQSPLALVVSFWPYLVIFAVAVGGLLLFRRRSRNRSG